MCAPVQFGGDTRIGAHDNRVQICVSMADRELVINAPCRKWRKRCDERHFAASGKPRGNTSHVGFRDTHVECSVGEIRFEA